MRSQRSSSSAYIQYGMRLRIMNGSNGRSPWLCARSWMRSHSAKACSETGSDATSPAASGGRLICRIRAAAPIVRRKRRASRSQKIAPKWWRDGRTATDTVSGNSVAHSLS